MEELYPTDYKLDQGFLLKLISENLIKGLEENSEIDLPVCVQWIGGREERGEWNSFQFTDGEFEVCRCAFLSKQPLPETYSILKINKISNLPLHISEYIRDYSEDGYMQHLLGEIQFEIEVSGEKIGHPLYEIKPHKYLDVVEILARKDAIGVNNFMESLTFESPSVKVMKTMWRNRDDKFCDVSFTFSDDRGSRAFAHKSVLTSVSDVFEAHFNGEDYRDGGSVNIVDTSFYYFNKLLEFIYIDNVQFTTLDVAFELLYLSKKYLLPNLEYQCQTTIIDHYKNNHENIFHLLTLNHKSNDKYVQDYFTTQIKEETRGVLNSADFLKCDYETVEWILSMEDLHIDEWSLLCALYKWACYNEINAFCDDAKEVVNQDGTPLECLHGLLECINFQNIDGESLQRFFKLPKLAAMLKIDEMKQCAFDGVLEDVNAFKRCYSTFRDFNLDNHFYIEIHVKNDFMDNFEETPLKILYLSDGSVLGLKVKICPDSSPEQLDNEFAVVMSTTVQYLYTNNNHIENSINVEFDANAKEFEWHWEGELVIGEPTESRLNIPDYRDYLSDKIESFGMEETSDSVWEKVLDFELVIALNEEALNEENNSD